MVCTAGDRTVGGGLSNHYRPGTGIQASVLLPYISCFPVQIELRPGTRDQEIIEKRPLPSAHGATLNRHWEERRLITLPRSVDECSGSFERVFGRVPGHSK